MGRKEIIIPPHTNTSLRLYDAVIILNIVYDLISMGSLLDRSFAVTCLITYLLFAPFVKVVSTTANENSRVPLFQDIEAAVASTKCLVREEVINIRELHPSLPPHARYFPSCVLMKRCSGCCQSQFHSCVPTSTYVTQIEISESFNSVASYIRLNFTHHASCQCRDPRIPSCVTRSCPTATMWNQESCRCEEICQKKKCPPRHKWNDELCQCECRPCHFDPSVLHRFIQNDNTCTCQCVVAAHGVPRCPRRTKFDHKHCKCIKHSYHRSYRDERGGGS